jgi:hypothetical protein
MNHLPDEAVTAIDAFGRGILSGDPQAVSARLRSDLRVHIPCDTARLAAGETRVEYQIDHHQTNELIRGYGSFVETYVDSVEKQLEAWGLDLPSAYEYAGKRDDWHVYTGELGLV